MASLMENIIDILNREDAAYQKLLGLSREKTPVIIKGDLEKLNEITSREQEIVNEVQKMERQRIQAMKDIAEVTNRSHEDLKLQDLINMMAKRPVERKGLQEVHDKLKATMAEMTRVNEQNRELLKNSLEMVQFEINLLNSLKTAPETADYNSNAYSTGTIMGSGTKRFDAKQ